MKDCLVLLALFVAPLFAFVIDDQSWQSWKHTYSKSYDEEGEERARYFIWKENMKKISDFNLQNKGMKLQMNHLGDMTEDELRYNINPFERKKVFDKTFRGSSFLQPNNVQLPKSVDWRKKGYVTPVQNQGEFGASWAFSAVGSVEGQYFKKTGELVPLSVQNLVDCCSNYSGLMVNAFQCIKDEGGIESEADYPTTERKGICHFEKSKSVTTVTGYVNITQGDEAALQAACATVGPISVAIDAGHLSFQFYHSGVYDEPDCSSLNIDHAVLLVGYGTTKEGIDYWIVKNSWGTSWGMKGYIMMSRNKHNQCGIASMASYPLL